MNFGNSDLTTLSENSSPSLVVGHPGHELLVYYWLEQNRPTVCCLTDGSGFQEVPRMDSTKRLVSRAGAKPGTLFGRVPDKAIYRHILEGKLEFFARLVLELADAWIAQGTRTVVGDAAEGMNPTHDICRFIIDAAVERVLRLTGRTLANYEFSLERVPNDCPEHLRGAAIWIRLPEDALERKLAAARDYPELKCEVDKALTFFGAAAFSIECLIPAKSSEKMALWENEPPPYESYGRQRVSQGHYQEVIFYRQHLWPIIEALRTAVDS